MFNQLGPKLQAQKASIIGQEILAPAARHVEFKLENLRFQIPTRGGPPTGLGMWRVAVETAYVAEFLRAPERREVVQALNTLPRSPFIWLGENRCHVFNLADIRFKDTVFTVENPLNLNLETFGTVEVAFWGKNLYAHRPTGRNRGLTLDLQKALAANAPVKRLDVPSVYASAYQHVHNELDFSVVLRGALVSREDVNTYVREALVRAGAVLVTLERLTEGAWRLTYRIPEVGTQVFTATFDPNFQLQTTGLCFRAQRPVGVTEFAALVREGFRRGHGHWEQRWTE